ncbi:MAG: EscT/YscT/HrcT family type III secretion system export apparatus protein [Bilophila wadsworthia]
MPVISYCTAIVASLPETQGLSPSTFALYGAILVKETLIGMFLGYLSGMLFWTIQCAGFFIDNQRGASMAEGPIRCPANRLRRSVRSFSRAPSTCFSTGAFLALLGVVYASYEIWPVTQLIPLSVFKDINLPLFFAGRVSWLLLMMLLLSGPIVVACLLTDVSLGLINRFASQLNVYVLAMPIKSGVAAFLMLFYFMMLLSNATGLFDGVKADFEQLRRLLP